MILSALCLATARLAIAGPFQYECEVKEVYDADGGQLRQRAKDVAIGQQFTISRESGEIIGSSAYVLNRAQGWKV